MAILLAALVLGITLADGWQAPAWAALGVLLGCLWPARRQGWGWLGALAGLALGVGSAVGWGLTPLPPLPEALQQAGVVVRGVVADREDRLGSVRLLLDEVSGGEPAVAPAGKVWLTIYRQTVTAQPGQRVRVAVQLRPLEPAQVPGQFDYAAYLWRDGVAASGFAKGPVAVEEETGLWRLNRWRQAFSTWVGEVAPPAQRGLVESLLVGKRGFLDEALRDALQTAGIFHLVAISGMHLSLVAGWSLFVLRLVLLLAYPLARRYDLKRPAALLTLVPVWLYAVLAGWSMATQRAAVMVTVFLLAVVLGRQHQGWRALGLATLLLLCWRPGELYQAGFQLSFVAVAVILWLLPHLPGGGWRWWLGAMVIMDAAIALVLTPLELHHFHRLSPYGLLVNLTCVPWVSFVSVPLGLLAMLLWPLWEGGAAGLVQLMGHSLAPVQALVAWVDGLPGAWQRLPGPPLAGLAGYLALGVGVLAARAWPARLGWALLAVALLAWPRAAPPAGQLLVAVLPVGQAQAAVVYLPGEGWSVIDAGGYRSAYYDVGESLISPYLWHYGVTRLERLVVSHPQRDHQAGAERLLRNFDVRRLWLGHFPDEERQSPEYREILLRAAERGTAVERMAADGPPGGAHWRVVSPLGGAGVGTLNDRSLALELVFGHHRLLFPGDLTRAGEKALLASGWQGPLTWLLAPHHGSKGSSSPDFVAASRPAQVVFSVAAGRPLPVPEVVERWRRSGAATWFTSRDGLVTTLSDGDTLTVRSSNRSEW